MNLNPRIPKIDESELEHWSEALLDLIPAKVEEQLAIMDEAEEERNRWSVMLTQQFARGKLDRFGLWFWCLWMEHRFSRYDKAQKWLNYWLELYQKVPLPKEPVHVPVREYKNEVDLGRIKQRPIEDFYQGDLRVNANRLVGKCPFHEEDTGSFFIFTDDNHFHCFGCQEHGDVITFIEKTKNMDFKEAVNFLK